MKPMQLKNQQAFAFGLIEVLITTVVLAIGLLGIAVIQQKAMLLFRDSDNGATAAMLVTDMANRIKANSEETQKGLSSSYHLSYTSVNDDLNGFETQDGDLAAHTSALNTLLSCDIYTTNTCTSANMAAVDLLEWKALIKKSLPNGAGIICFDSVPATNANNLACNGINPGESDPTFPSLVYTIKIRWIDSTNADRFFMSQTVYPCLPTGCNAP